METFQEIYSKLASLDKSVYSGVALILTSALSIGVLFYLPHNKKIKMKIKKMENLKIKF